MQGFKQVQNSTQLIVSINYHHSGGGNDVDDEDEDDGYADDEDDDDHADDEDDDGYADDDYHSDWSSKVQSQPRNHSPVFHCSAESNSS